ncbi:DUF192 domain-containing protein [Clostridium grantii]|uniref:DUF192 domain-containing protein n=1 Tax=Clostridium grantii DSM 8605 TaxID=1121316 RepID=A0A1M5XBT6_9CLOT|nr:DUF192 domain-containing protein [Clostridium grantii]SHH96974.1 hypothetical protein SAMN02745207_03516 [Clostridium grantii DSM 8605]
MQIKNKTKNLIVSKEVIIAKNFYSRLKGLLGKENLPENQCLIIYPCKSIHTFFMKFPIDAVFIDKNYKVLKILKNIKPGKTSSYVKKSWAVIEMPVNTLVESKISTGDELLLLSDNI